MRKKKFIYAALALVILGLTACQQEEDFTPQEQEINLNITAGGVQTRVNTLDVALHLLQQLHAFDVEDFSGQFATHRI